MAATVKTNVVVSIGAFVSVFHLFTADLFDVSPVLRFAFAFHEPAFFVSKSNKISTQ